MVQSLKHATFRNQFFPILVDFEARAGEHMRKNRGIFFVCIEWIYWFTSSSLNYLISQQCCDSENESGNKRVKNTVVIV